MASEVKELARQSGASAGQIDEKIRSILARISDVASSVGHLQDSIQAISEASQNIAATTEEQSVTAKSLAAEISSMNQAGQNLTTQIHANTEAMANIALQGKSIEGNCSELSSVTHERNQKGLSRLNLLKQALGGHHEIVHQSARLVALAMEQQKYPEAKTQLQHFEEARMKLFACLDSLYVEN